MESLSIFNEILSMGLPLILILLVILVVLIFLFAPKKKTYKTEKSGGTDIQVRFSRGALAKMQSMNLTEKQVLDTFYYGEKKVTARGQDMMVKRYPDGEIGLLFEKRDDGRWNIFSVWKR